MLIEEIRLDDIRVPLDWRKANMAEVKRIASSIELVGLLQPIGVTPMRTPDEPDAEPKRRLLWGRHRMLAYQSLGWETVPAHIMELDDVQAEMTTLVENLRTAPLSKLERGEQTARAKELYHAMFPETRKGVAGGKASGKARGSDSETNHGTKCPVVQPDAATAIGKETGKKKRTVNRAAEVGSIPPEIRDMVRNTPVENRQNDLKDLARICREAPAQGRKLAETVNQGLADTLKGAKTVLLSEQNYVRDQRGGTVRGRIRPAVLVLPDIMANVISLQGRLATAVKRARERLQAASEKHVIDPRTMPDALEVLSEARERRLRKDHKQAQRSVPHVECENCHGLGENPETLEECGFCNRQGWISAGLFTAMERQKKEAAAQ